MTVDLWNTIALPGTRVAWMKDDGRVLIGRTRSKAVEIAGIAVVEIEAHGLIVEAVRLSSLRALGND